MLLLHTEGTLATAGMSTAGETPPMVETQGTSGMAKTTERSRTPCNSMNVKKQKRSVRAWTQTIGPEAMFTTAGPSNSRSANSSMYAKTEGTPDKRRDATTLETPETEGMSTSAGPQQQHPTD